MQVSNIIHLALKQLGVLATGESATADDVADGVEYLRMLLAGWATKKLYVYKMQTLSLALDGKQHLAGVQRLAEQALLDGKPINLIRDSNLVNTGNIHFGQVSDGFWVDGKGQLVVKAYYLPTAISPNDELDVPPNYELALVLSLALEIAPMYGVEPSGLLLKNHAKAIANLEIANSTPYWAKNELSIGLTGGGCGCF